MHSTSWRHLLSPKLPQPHLPRAHFSQRWLPPLPPAADPTSLLCLHQGNQEHQWASLTTHLTICLFSGTHKLCLGLWGRVLMWKSWFIEWLDVRGFLRALSQRSQPPTSAAWSLNGWHSRRPPSPMLTLPWTATWRPSLTCVKPWPKVRKHSRAGERCFCECVTVTSGRRRCPWRRGSRGSHMTVVWERTVTLRFQTVVYVTLSQPATPTPKLIHL